MCRDPLAPPHSGRSELDALQALCPPHPPGSGNAVIPRVPVQQRGNTALPTTDTSGGTAQGAHNTMATWTPQPIQIGLDHAVGQEETTEPPKPPSPASRLSLSTWQHSHLPMCCRHCCCCLRWCLHATRDCMENTTPTAVRPTTAGRHRCQMPASWRALPTQVAREHCGFSGDGGPGHLRP